MKLVGLNMPFNEQIETLKEILWKNDELVKILKILEESNLKNYYVAAGSINQTIINYYTDRDLNYGNSDYDIVYFDEDTSYNTEYEITKSLMKKFEGIIKEFDIKNQARVHLWYEDKFGYAIAPFTSVEHAISSWGSTITCIGVRLEKERLIVCAPYGLNDVFNLIIRPVKDGVFDETSFNKKVAKWTSS